MSMKPLTELPTHLTYYDFIAALDNIKSDKTAATTRVRFEAHTFTFGGFMDARRAKQ